MLSCAAYADYHRAMLTWKHNFRYARSRLRVEMHWRCLWRHKRCLQCGATRCYELWTRIASESAAEHNIINTVPTAAAVDHPAVESRRSQVDVVSQTIAAHAVVVSNRVVAERTVGASVAVIRLVVAVRRLVIHVVGVVAACIGPRRSVWVVGRALSIRAVVHHSIVIVIHLQQEGEKFPLLDLYLCGCHDELYLWIILIVCRCDVKGWVNLWVCRKREREDAREVDTWVRVSIDLHNRTSLKCYTAAGDFSSHTANLLIPSQQTRREKKLPGRWRWGERREEDKKHSK